MYAKNWSLSPRAYDVVVERGVRIRMSDGVHVVADIFRPSGSERHPAILGVHAYDPGMQSTHSMPISMRQSNAPAEAGDPYFYARRGYAHVLVNARGTGPSEGKYSNYAPREVEDYREVIDWLSKQRWCTGKVGMFGASFFSVAAKQVAATNPPALAAVWAMYGYSDFYRDKFYHGGILAQTFLTQWAKAAISNGRTESWSKKNLSPEDYADRLAVLSRNQDVMANPDLAAAVRNPEFGANGLILDVLLNPTDGPYWQERSPDLSKIRVPIVLGACWGMYALHLPAEFRAWQEVKAPKKLIVGPPIYLDRPIYQYANESLRFFDHWLKGNDTGYMEETPVQVFLTGNEGNWLEADDWPLPQTIWHPFFLHRDGLLSEHEHWPHEGATGFEDNVYNGRGRATFVTPQLVERTVVLGPAHLSLYVSSTDTDIHLFASVWDVPPEGPATLLSRGWLKASMRKTDEARARPGQKYFSMDEPKPLVPDEIVRVDINIVEIGHVFRVGHRISVKISTTDEDPPRKYLDVVGQGHQLRRNASWVSVHHDVDHPSVLHLPIIAGNRIGTFMSGGQVEREGVVGGAWELWNK